MTSNSMELPAYLLDAGQAEEFAALYLGDGPSPRARLAKLEQQALFCLLVEALETPEMNFKELVLCPPDDPEDSIWIKLTDVDGDELDVASEDEEIAASAVLLLNSLEYLRDHAFVETLSDQPLTHENKWRLAEQLFDKEIASGMQARHLQKTVPNSGAVVSRPRM